MQWLYTLYVLPLFFSAVAAGILAFYLWERRDTSGAGPLAVMMLLVALWSQFAVFRIITNDITEKTVWTNFEYTLITFIPVFWLAFSCGHTGRLGWLVLRNQVILSLIPAISAAFLWTNPFHQLFFSDISLHIEGLIPYLDLEFGSWYIVWLIYSFGLVTIGTMFMVSSLKRPNELSSRQTFIQLIGSLIVWVVFVLLFVEVLPVSVSIIPPIALMISGAVLALGLFNFRLKNLMPIARTRVVEHMPDGVIVFDERNEAADLNPAACEMLGFDYQDMVGKPYNYVLSRFPKLIDTFFSPEETLLKTDLQHGEEQRSFEVHLTPLPNVNRGLPGRLVVFREVTEHYRSKNELEKSHALLLATLEATADGILVVNARGNSVRYNKKFIEMWHIAEEVMQSGTTQDYMAFILDQLVNPAAFYRLMSKLSTSPDAESFDVLELKDGRVFERYSCPQKIGDRRVGRVWSFRDVTEQRRAEEKLRYLSTHDILTGLYNRVYFEEEINRLEKSRQFPVSVVMADVDGLKETNDQYGHQAGDVLLRRTAEVLRKACRAEDMVARLGGDEFGIILPFSDVKVAENAINRINNMLTVDPAGNGEYPISVSLGTATAINGESLRRVLREADKAMYLSKSTKTRTRIQTGPLRGSPAIQPQTQEDPKKE